MNNYGLILELPQMINNKKTTKTMANQLHPVLYPNVLLHGVNDKELYPQPLQPLQPKGLVTQLLQLHPQFISFPSF